MTTPMRVSWAVSAPAGKIQLMDARHALAAVFMPGANLIAKRGGMLPGPGTPGAVTATTPTPDNMVRVAPFQLVLPSSRALAGAVAAPPYVVTNDRSVAFNAFATPPSAVADRRDLIIAQQNDSSQGDADSEANLRYIVGNAPAADPAVTGSQDYVILAQVTVRQNAASVLQTDIVSRVPAAYWTVALGGVLPVFTAAERDAVPTPHEGMTVWRGDKSWAEMREGAFWRVQGIPVVSTFAALAADITHPRTGQLAFVTADQRLYRYTGAAWTYAAPTGAIQTLGPRITSGVASSSNTPVGLIRDNASDLVVQPGQLYTIVLRAHIFGSVANDRMRIDFRHTTNGALPTTASPIMPDGSALLHIIGGDLVISARYAFEYRPATAHTLRILVSYHREAGTGSVRTYGDANFRTWVDTYLSGAVQPGNSGVDL